jgi:hypothetical protein
MSGSKTNSSLKKNEDKKGEVKMSERKYNRRVGARLQIQITD